MSVIGRILPLRTRDERGATAIVFALAATVMLGAGALAVDVGQVFTARAELQQAVDKAAVAAASQLDGTAVCSDAVKDQARKYLAANWPRTAGNQLTEASIPLDGTAAGGTITCGTDWTVKLTAPTARVDYGLAKAVTTASGVDVPATATAGVFSPKGMHMLPAYATVGCSYGSQIVFESPSTKNIPVDGSGCTVDEGNFGGLKLPRVENLNENAELAANIALGPQFTLALYPDPSRSRCGSSNGVVYVKGAANEGINCVDTLRGFRSNAAQAGLTGSSPKGLLVAPTSSQCSSRGQDNILGTSLNNDRLECFFDSEPAGGVQSLASADYSGGPVLNKAVVQSPRFVWMPVISLSPDATGDLDASDSVTCNGVQCNGYFTIQDMRPGFIMGPNPDGPEVITSDLIDHNGLLLEKERDLGAVRIFLFNESALPEQTYFTDTQTYFGVGPKVVRLVD